MKKYFLGWMYIVLMAFLSAGFVSCGSDSSDDSNGGQSGNNSSNGQWFIKRIPFTVNLMKFDIEAITFYGNNLTVEELRKDNIAGNGSVIHLVNSNTLEVLSDDYFCEDGASVSNKQLLYRVNTGTSLGTLAFYSSHSTPYTYEKIDNKLYVPMWGKIFTVTSEGLWEDGGKLYSSYNPNTEIYSFDDLD